MNLFDLPSSLGEQEDVTALLDREGIRLERIVSAGHVTGWYDQEEWEYVILLQGSAALFLEEKGEVALSRGDTLLIPPHSRHRVVRTSVEPPCVWLCVFWRESF